MDARKAVPDDVVAGHEVEQLLQRDGAFHPGQRGAQTTVDSVAEPEVLRLGAVAVDVELVGVGECFRIPVRRGADQEHRFARRNGAAGQMRLFEGVADVVLDRSFVAQQLFHRRRDLTAVVEQFLPLVRVAREDHDRVADQLGDGLGAGPTQKHCETGYFDIVEFAQLTVGSGDLRGDQPADHVVLRICAPFLDQVVVVHRRIDVGLHTGFADLDLSRFAMQAGVDPVPDLLPGLLRHAGHPGDDLHRERGGEVLDDVELVGVDGAQILVDQLDHRLPLRLDRSGGECLVEQAAHVAVVGRIHEDDRLLGDVPGPHHCQVAPAGRREGFVILERRGHVLVPGERVEVLLRVVIKRCFLAHPPVYLERIVEVFLGKGIEDQG